MAFVTWNANNKNDLIEINALENNYSLLPEPNGGNTQKNKKPGQIKSNQIK